MATKFADLSKPATSLLNDDYTSKVTVKAKTAAGPVGLTIETEQGKDSSLSSKLSGKFVIGSFNVDKLEHAADGSKKFESSIKVNPDIKVTFKAAKGADLGVEYVKGNLYATGSVDVMDMSKVTSSACFFLPGAGVKAGGDVVYKMNGGGLSDFNLGASYVIPNGRCFGAVTAQNKFSKCNLALVYKPTPKLVLASLTTHSSSKICEVGGVGLSYKADGIGTIKAKMATNHVFHACLIRDIAPKVTLTASGSVTGADLSTFKPGIGLQI